MPQREKEELREKEGGEKEEGDSLRFEVYRYLVSVVVFFARKFAHEIWRDVPIPQNNS